MKVTVTYLELKTPWKFFALSANALQINRQLRQGKCVKVKTIGFWTKHYTMSLWNSEEDLKEFASTGAHLDAMKRSAVIAKEIRTITYDAQELPDWKVAKLKLGEAKPLIFR